MMRAAEMKTLRAIKGVSLRNQIRSKVIREDLEVQDIVKFTMARRFWRDHVKRMTEGRLAKWAKDEIILGELPADFLTDGARAGHLQDQVLGKGKEEECFWKTNMKI
ncbi:hypothetical protein Trydic_g20966 [Trypoxylus dichotomus]